MSVTVSGTNGWVSVTEAAMLAQVSERTVQRWIESGRVESDMSDEGRRRVRRESVIGGGRILPDRVPDDDPGRKNSSEASDTSDRLTDTLTDTMSDVVECPTGSGTAAGPRLESLSLECACCKVREEQVSDLRHQLEVRNRAEEQLRMMMAHLERTNAELATSLCQKALPPAPDTQPPARVRWWQLWRRG